MFELTIRGVVNTTVFDFNAGDDLLEAETIMSDVAQRRRRVFGPAHPETIIAQKNLSRIRANLARA